MADPSDPPDNIEPLARAITEQIARRVPSTEAEIAAWVDGHWHCAAAELEAGLIDETGAKMPGYTVEAGLAALRERSARLAR
ncbi:hypothetical protein J2847_004100 [Azospirillum agricola]|uniref:hypothetical protein n=1 Tax=Azospirillum agricola TaxID=1720247 RepID=UPI001AE72742|nr:hypothetical protein [Azospirillum agricola]MBP2230791.1 hypothetical protein [Azospirillum agricola]